MEPDAAPCRESLLELVQPTQHPSCHSQRRTCTVPARRCAWLRPAHRGRYGELCIGTHSRLTVHDQPAKVVAAGRRRCPRSPAHARGRPPQTAIRSRINTAVPCNHGGRPRMVPAPGGTTAALVHRGWRATPSPATRVPGQVAWGTGAGTIRGGRDQRTNRRC